MTISALRRAARILFVAAALPPAVHASPWTAQLDSVATTHLAVAPVDRVNWYAFAPEDNGMELVLYGVHSARRSIHVLAYVMTYRPLLEALATKSRAGVQVAVAVDYGESIANDRGGYIRRGLDYLARAGVYVCAVDRFKLMHDKTMILDGRSIQTGSINYSSAGAKANSENAVIEWNDLQSAEAFEKHFQSRLSGCRPLAQIQ
ncbi:MULTISPECIES: phospholipase D-like domain-containing protein [Burkholderia]|uniref:phospholipase D n=1 Tax=Burkholderia pseudomallei TaxID=28450 RepID=A0A0C5B144_BURPE|nr:MULTISPECIES: phospholipase D-like domain-containing protein [Burkholderia]AJL34912.1 putative endonuclease [Burkholderia pseudomallei]